MAKLERVKLFDPARTETGLRKKSFPDLFNKGSKGEVRKWNISVREREDGVCEIVSTYGVLDGNEQVAVEEISEGKNVGRANETTTWEQALSEAESTWKKKKDAKYAEAGQEATHLLPMLALKFTDKESKIKFPVYVQPKFDGVRCLAEKVSDTKMRYTSRKGKEYLTFGHFDEFLLSVLEVGEVFDGEIYSPDLTFEEIISQVKRFKGDRSSFNESLRFYLYDVASANATYTQRYDRLRQALSASDSTLFALVETCVAINTNEVKELHNRFVSEGFEGCMVRTMSGKYRYQYRSPDLLKYKEFIDEEFEIVGGKEGTGKDKGTIIFRVKNANGDEFDCRPKGSHSQRTEWFTTLEDQIGKPLTVRYQELTAAGIPRFPIGIAVRDYE